MTKTVTQEQQKMRGYIVLNKLIIVEGLPCSGKSTTAKYIADRLGAKFYDEGSGNHPADYEFHAFLRSSEISSFSAEEQALIRQSAVCKADGYIIPLQQFSGELFDKLLQHKIYDFLPWETEKPVMLGKWKEFVQTAEPDAQYVLNCVLLQNPMCETMMRFGFDMQVSSEYISSICEIIKPLNPFLVYLHSDHIRSAIEKAVSERGTDWLHSVIDYHCSGAYGKSRHLSGFDGYIAALEERQRRETKILHSLNVPYLIIRNPDQNWDSTYAEIMQALKKIN